MNATELLQRLNEEDMGTDEVPTKGDHKEMVMHILNSIAHGTLSSEEGQHALAHYFLTHDAKISDVDSVVDHIHNNWMPGQDDQGEGEEGDAGGDMGEALGKMTKKILKGTAVTAGLVGAAAAGGMIGQHGLHGALDIAHQFADHVMTQAGHKVTALNQAFLGPEHGTHGVGTTPATSIEPLAASPELTTPTAHPHVDLGSQEYAEKPGLMSKASSLLGRLYTPATMK